MQWFKNRIRAIGPVNASTVYQDVMFYPTEEVSVAVNTAVASRHNLHRVFFDVIRSLGWRQKGTCRNAFASITRLLQFAELGHLYFIMCYLLGSHPELLAVTDLAFEETSILQRALALMATMNEGEAGYARLLKPPAEIDILSSKYYKRFTAVAKTVAAYYEGTLSQYRTKKDPQLDRLIGLVNDYLDARRSLGRPSAIEALSRFLGPNTRVLAMATYHNVQNPEADDDQEVRLKDEVMQRS